MNAYQTLFAVFIFGLFFGAGQIVVHIFIRVLDLKKEILRKFALNIVESAKIAARREEQCQELKERVKELESELNQKMIELKAAKNYIADINLTAKQDKKGV